MGFLPRRRGSDAFSDRLLVPVGTGEIFRVVDAPWVGCLTDRDQTLRHANFHFSASAPGRVTNSTDVAVVIDVLRATSVMATALEAGAAQIITCREVAEANEIADRLSTRPLLCGERGCKPIEGFDLGNSPADYVPSRVQGKTLVLTTTNGTRAIDAAGDAARIITASFLNFSAVIDLLKGTRRVHLVCAGTEGEITAEDALLAGALMTECATRYQAVSEDDDSVLASQLWLCWFAEVGSAAQVSPQELSRRLRQSRGGRNLVRAGYESDLDRCAMVDSIRAVPERIAHSPMTFGLQATSASTL